MRPKTFIFLTPIIRIVVRVDTMLQTTGTYHLGDYLIFKVVFLKEKLSENIYISSNIIWPEQVGYT